MALRPIVMAKWEGELDEARLQAALAGSPLADTEAVDDLDVIATPELASKI